MNESQLLAAIAEISGIPRNREDGWMTKREIIEATRKGEKQIGDLLHRLHQAGRLDVAKIPMLTITGHYYPKTVYRVKEAKP